MGWYKAREKNSRYIGSLLRDVSAVFFCVKNETGNRPLFYSPGRHRLCCISENDRPYKCYKRERFWEETKDRPGTTLLLLGISLAVLAVGLVIAIKMKGKVI